jgi:hypothetical protein
MKAGRADLRRGGVTVADVFDAVVFLVLLPFVAGAVKVWWEGREGRARRTERPLTGNE